MMFHRLACFIFFSAWLSVLCAQNDRPLPLGHEQWQELADGVDYSENFKDSEPEKNNKKFPGRNISGFNFSGLKYPLYFLVLALVIFLAFRVIMKFSSNTEVSEKVITIDAIEEIEENMHEIDLNALLKKALEAKRYRVALRLHFLIIIKLLSQKGEITWAKEKTNWEYYTELHDKLMADQFKEIIVSFETFWYGEHILSEIQFHRTEPLYLAMQKRLTPNE